MCLFNRRLRPEGRRRAIRIAVLKPADTEAAVAERRDNASRLGAAVRGGVPQWGRRWPPTAPGPLVKVASGGELSRFLLALKVALADRGSAPTLIFDEVDAGAGGAVAEAIGRRLARLAERVQVLSVTHAPQVAAHAARHFLITKATTGKGKGVVTKVAAISEEGRREEIARMLAGETISDEARAAAERLMAG